MTLISEANELYSITKKNYPKDTQIFMLFCDNLPRRFVSDAVYIVFGSNDKLFYKLSGKYPSTHNITIYQKKENRIESTKITLKELPSYYDDIAIVIPPVELENSISFDVDDLCAIMKRLRAPGGCPWDIEQTHESLKTSLIEEAYEVLDAIDKNDREGLIEELGDVLLQIVFHTELENEIAPTDIDAVSTGIVKKLIYRHPHVFGDVNAATSSEVLINWDKLKNKEKHIESVCESMRRVSVGMPALMRAKRVQKKAAKIGFDWDDAISASDKIKEETQEAIYALKQNDDEAAKEELGDLLFSVVNVARIKGFEPELLLEAVIDKFISRFDKMEKLIIDEFGTIEGHSLELMDKYWDIAKEQEKRR